MYELMTVRLHVWCMNTVWKGFVCGYQTVMDLKRINGPFKEWWRIQTAVRTQVCVFQVFFYTVEESEFNLSDKVEK